MFNTESQKPTHTKTHTIVTPTISCQQVVVLVSIARKSQHHDGAAAERQRYDQDGLSRLPHVSATTERTHGPLLFKTRACCIIRKDAMEGRGGRGEGGQYLVGRFVALFETTSVAVQRTL